MYKTQHKCRAIMEAAETVFGLPDGTISGPRRTQDVCRPRFIAIKLMSDTTKLSYQRIGHLVNRDHTTVINAIQRAEKFMGEDAEYANMYTQVKQVAQDLAGFDFVRGHLPIFKSVRGE